MLAHELPSNTSDGLKLVTSNRPKFLSFPERNRRLEIGFMDDESQLKRAAQIIVEGGVVAAQLGNIYGLFLDASNPNAVAHEVKIKGKSGPEPLSIMMSSTRLLDILDKNKVHPDLKHLISDGQTLGELVGGICHVRGPVRSDYLDLKTKTGEELIPQSILSWDENNNAFVHNLDPHGYENVEKWISMVNKMGVRFVGVSSLNYKGTPERYCLPDAIEFCLNGLVNPNALLIDPNPVDPRIKGSYAILNFATAFYVRDGQIPVEVVDQVLGVNISEKEHPGGIKPAKFERDFDFSVLIEKFSGAELRTEILKSIQ